MQIAEEIIVFFLAQVMELNRSETLRHENSFFINEALVQMSLHILAEKYEMFIVYLIKSNVILWEKYDIIRMSTHQKHSFLVLII